MRSSNCDYSLKWLLEDENGKKRQKNEKHFSRRSAFSRDRRGLNSQPPA